MSLKADVDITVLTYKVIDRVGCRRKPSTFPRRNSGDVYNTDTIIVKLGSMDLIGVKDVVTVKVNVCLKSVRG
jgi:hypothetical protein